MNITLFLLYITIPISIFSGHAIAPLFVIGAFCLVPSLVKNHPPLSTIILKLLNKPLIYINLLLIFSLISVGWAVYKMKAIVLLLQLLAVYICYMIYTNSRVYEKLNFTKFANLMIFALILAGLELIWDGQIMIFLRKLMGQDNFLWHMTDINRGLTLIALLMPLIYNHLKQKHDYYRLSGLGLIYILVTLFADSLAAKVILLINVAMLLVLQIMPKIKSTLKFLLLSTILIFPVICLMVNPKHIEQKYEYIGGSSIHRVFIWHYSAKTTYENFPILGAGFNQIRDWPVKLDDYHPLYSTVIPLHSHSHILQIWFELGLVGLIIYLLFMNSLINKVFQLRNHNMVNIMFTIICSGFAAQAVTYGIWQQWWICTFLLISVISKKALNLNQSH